MSDSDSVTTNTADVETEVSDQCHTCPECETTNTVVVDASTAETYCTQCGLVLAESRLDRGPEWLAVNAESERRVGGPLTDLRHDRGLSAEIGYRVDGHGNTLSGGKQRQFTRLRRWNAQAKFESTQDQNLARGLGEIQRIGSTLDLPDSVQNRAGRLFREAVHAGLLTGRSVEAVATASVYAACRLRRLPWFFEEVAERARVDAPRVRAAYKVLNRELDLAAPPPLPRDFLPRLASETGVPTEVEQYARTLLDLPAVTALANGRKPGCVAAGCLYYAARELMGYGAVTQDQLAATARVSTPSLRTMWRTLTDLEAEEDFSFPSPSEFD